MFVVFLFFIFFCHLYVTPFLFPSYFILNGLERVVRLLILPKRNYVSEPFCIFHIIVIVKQVNVFNLEVWLEHGSILNSSAPKKLS